MKKPVFYTEAAFFLGLWLLAWGTALTAWADFGISMVVAPAYILHLALSGTWSWFSFGVGEYVLQAVILLLMMALLRRVKVSYFLSFLTAILYGLLLDGGMAVFGWLLPEDALFWQRVAVYVGGDVAICAGVALMFKTYLPPEAYEMFVKEIATRAGIRLHVFKTAYDCASLLIAVILSLALLGELQGVGIATVICAFVNGTLIKWCDQFLERLWEFKDRFALRPKFEKGVNQYE